MEVQVQVGIKRDINARHAEDFIKSNYLIDYLSYRVVNVVERLAEVSLCSAQNAEAII